MWDLGSGKLIEEIKWNQGVVDSGPCMLYAAKFSKDPTASLIAAGGSGSNEAKVRDNSVLLGLSPFI